MEAIVALLARTCVTLESFNFKVIARTAEFRVIFKYVGDFHLDAGSGSRFMRIVWIFMNYKRSPLSSFMDFPVIL